MLWCFVNVSIPGEGERAGPEGVQASHTARRRSLPHGPGRPGNAQQPHPITPTLPALGPRRHDETWWPFISGSLEQLKGISLQTGRRSSAQTLSWVCWPQGATGWGLRARGRLSLNYLLKLNSKLMKKNTVDLKSTIIWFWIDHPKWHVMTLLWKFVTNSPDKQIHSRSSLFQKPVRTPHRESHDH